MFSYSARPWHYFISISILAIAEIARRNDYVLFGIFVYIVGMLAAFCITYSFVYEVRYFNSLRDEKHAREQHEEHLDDLGSVRIEMNTSPTQTRLFDLPASPRQLEQLATGLMIAADPFSQRRWTGKGKPFSINQFNSLRDEMLRRELIRLINEKDPRQGYELSGFGRSMMKRFLPSPALQAFNTLQGTE